MTGLGGDPVIRAGHHHGPIDFRVLAALVLARWNDVGERRGHEDAGREQREGMSHRSRSVTDSERPPFSETKTSARVRIRTVRSRDRSVRPSRRQRAFPDFSARLPATKNDPLIPLNFQFASVDTSVTEREHGFNAVRRTTMQRRLTVSLVALQLVVACGYAVAAQDAQRPSYARSSASRTTAALAGAPARAAVAQADKPADELTLRMTPRFVSAPGYLRSLIRVAPNAANRAAARGDRFGGLLPQQRHSARRRFGADEPLRGLEGSAGGQVRSHRVGHRPVWRRPRRAARSTSRCSA